MDLDFTEEQQMLRDTVRGLCAQRAPVDIVRKMEDDPIGYPPDFWQQLGALGVTGLLLPEEFGGAGMSALEGTIVYEELGSALAPSPHFASAVMSGGALVRAGSQEQRQTWLPPIASGKVIITPAWLEPSNGYGPTGVQMRAIIDGDNYRLTGTKRHVVFAKAAHQFLVLARTGSKDTDVALLLVDPKSPGIELTQQYSLASDCQYQVSFNDVRVPTSQCVGIPQSGWSTWDEVMHEGIILLGAQAVGGAARALAITVQYSKDRVQFDKPLGAFQAIAHYLADAATAIDGASTLVYQAAWARSKDKPVSRLAPMAKLFACQTFRDVTAMAQQVQPI